MPLRRPTASCAAAIAAVSLLAFQAPARATPFVGQVMCAGFNFPPVGWLRLDGQLLPIAQYDVLFALIGTTYGGDGKNTFAVPDMRGRFLKHNGQGPGLPGYLLGQQGGVENTIVGAAQLPAHGHSATPLASTGATRASPAGAVPGTLPRTTLYAPGPGTVAMQGTASSSVGSSVPVPVVPPFTAINCFIATEGIFPSPARADSTGARQP